jgi:hypothetical protein
MPKPIRTRHELEQLIVSAVRQRPDCDGFQSIALHPVVGPSARGKFNWAPGVCDYGEASPASCEAALREIIPRLQQRYDLAPG